MKRNNSFIIALLSAILLLSSCEIEEAKTPATVPDVQLFNYCESNTFNTLEQLDNVIGLSLYLNAPDSVKNVTLIKVLKGMVVIKTRPFTYKLVKYDNKSYVVDTVNTVIIDSSSIFTKGAKWKIIRGSNYYYYNMPKTYNDTSIITCLDATKWSFKTNRTRLSDFLTSGELIISSNGKRPLFFSKVTVIGTNDLTQKDTTNNLHKVNYSIKTTLVKDSLRWKFKEGKFSSVWEDMKLNTKFSIDAEYSIQNKTIVNGQNKTILENSNSPHYYQPIYQTPY